MEFEEGQVEVQYGVCYSYFSLIHGSNLNHGGECL